MSQFTTSLHRLCLCTALALGSVTTGFTQAKAERNYQFDDETIETLDLFRKENEAPKKDHEKILGLLDGRLAKIKDKKSYDYAMILQFKAKILIEKGDYAKAAEPMEQGLALSDAANPTYLDERATADVSFFLAQLIFQEAQSLKKISDQVIQYGRAEQFITRWLTTVKHPTEDGLTFYISLLYARAVLDEKNVDKTRLVKAMDLIDQTMRLTTRPKDGLYLYKMACLQQLDRPAESAEIFELLLKKKPENKDYWKQLAATYMGLEQPVKAVVTLERAQGLGLLNTPADNYSLFGIYFNEGQFEQAAELLESGFKNKTIENSQQNWELLANCYQQLNREFKQIDALKRAIAVFPNAGQLDFLVAQSYYSMKKLEEALPYLQSSIRKGGGTKPAQAYIFLAYIAFELKKFEIALEAANNAIKLPDGVKEGTRFKKAVLDEIKAREDKLKKM